MEDNSQNAATILAAIEALKKPVGIGPVASGDAYGKMLQQNPTNTFVAPAKSVNIPESAPSRQEENYVVSRVTGKPTAQQTPSPRQEKMAEDVGPIQAAPSQDSPITIEAAKDMVDQQQIAPEIKEQVKSSIDNKDQLKDKDPQTMSLPEKMAIIAMAVAPTVIGYAAHGTKGAYLGAASTGKGLAAGLEEQKDREKLAIAKAKALKATSTKPGSEKADKIIEDNEGNMWFLKENNDLRPVINPTTGQQMRRANVEITGYDESGQPFKRMKFEQAKETRPSAARASAVEVYNDIVNTAREKKIKGIIVPPTATKFAETYGNYSSENTQPPQGVEKAAWDADRARFNKWVSDSTKQLSVTQKPKTQASTTQSDRRYEKSLEEGIIKSKYVPLEAIRTKQTIYLDNGGAFIDSADGNTKEFVSLSKLKNVTAPALWQTYLRAVQQDESVVRPGESETAQAFMSIKTKFEGWINKYGKLESSMTDELAGDIKKLFQLSQSLRERDLVLAMNEEAKNAQQLGKLRVFVERMPGDAKAIAKNFALERSIKEPLDSNQVKEMIASGKLRAGDIVTSKATGRKEILRQTNPIRFEPWRLYQ